MSDLIDRNNAVEAIEFEKVYMTAYKGSSNGYVSEGNPFKQYNKGLDDAIKAINNLASTDRKNGRWIYLDECANAGYYCDQCNKRVVKNGWSKTVKKINFCPNCGADMRGE